jgi:hypothetical protein
MIDQHKNVDAKLRKFIIATLIVMGDHYKYVVVALKYNIMISISCL